MGYASGYQDMPNSPGEVFYGMLVENLLTTDARAKSMISGSPRFCGPVFCIDVFLRKCTGFEPSYCETSCPFLRTLSMREKVQPSSACICSTVLVQKVSYMQFRAKYLR